MGGLGRTIMDGMAFGTGSAIAHRAVGAVAGSMFGGAAAPEAAPAAAEAAAPAASRGQDCSPFMRDFSACIAEHRNDIAQCQIYSDSFNSCQQSNGLR